MLLREGVSKGVEPTVQVMEIAANKERKSDDLFPYLSPFAQFFRALPRNPKDFILKTALIPLNDVECLTRTVIDIPQGVENLNRKKGKHVVHFTLELMLISITDALKLAQDQFVPLCQSWNYQDWDEYDYEKIKNLKFKEIEMARRQKGQEAAQRECIKCPDFLKHVSREIDGWLMVQANDHSSLWSMMNGSLRRTFFNFASSCPTKIYNYCQIMNKGFPC